MKQLIRSSQQLIQHYNFRLTLENQAKNHQIVQKIKKINISKLNLQIKNENAVGFRNIYDQNKLRISIYSLPQNYTMKLHDHPQMAVISSVLSGTMLASHYTKINQGCYTRQIKQVNTSQIMYIDGLKTNKNNLHQFKAKKMTIFLDIIYPDYDQYRNCTYYDVKQVNNTITLEPSLNYYQMFYEI